MTRTIGAYLITTFSGRIPIDTLIQKYHEAIAIPAHGGKISSCSPGKVKTRIHFTECIAPDGHISVNFQGQLR